MDGRLKVINVCTVPWVFFELGTVWHLNVTLIRYRPKSIFCVWDGISRQKTLFPKLVGMHFFVSAASYRLILVFDGLVGKKACIWSVGKIIRLL